MKTRVQRSVRSGPRPLTAGATLGGLFMIGIIRTLGFVHLFNVPGFIVHGRARQLTEPLLHEPSDFELHRSLFRDSDRLEGFGILRLSRLANFGFEYTKVSKFESVAPTQFIYDFVKKLLDDLLDLNSPMPGGFGNTIDQLFLRDGGHNSLKSRITPDGKQTY